MKKKLIAITLFAFLACGSVAFAASTIYGISGLIETPNDTYVPVYDLGVTANYAAGMGSSSVDGNFASFGGSFGLMRNLEVSGVVATTSRPDSSAQGIFNAKFRALTETYNRPSISVGVVDAIGQLDGINPDLDSTPSLFFMLGKNLTPALEGISGTWCRPFVVTAGFGSGVYKGAFVGADYWATQRFELMFEYLSTGISADTDFNAGFRWYPSCQLGIKAGAIDFRDFFVGASYTFELYNK